MSVHSSTQIFFGHFGLQTLRYAGVIWLLSLIGHTIYLIGVHFGEDQRTNTINTHFSKEIGPPLHTQL